MAGPDDRDATAPDSGERVHPAWLVVEMAVIAAGVLLVNLWPQWVGGVVLGSAEQPWRFLPILTPEIRAYLPWLNLWWGLALALKVMLLRRRRWERGTRQADLALRALGAVILVRMATGESIVGLHPEWMAWHGWPAEAWRTQERLVPALATGVRFVLLAGAVAMAIQAWNRLRVGRWLRKLVKEGMAGRNFPEILDLFKKDASRAYEVLDRDQAFGPEPKGGLRRMSHRTKVLFAGVARQLSPARRLLFVVAVACAILNILASPNSWSVAATGGLFLLLVLELVDRVRVRDELAVARELQRDLLPTGSPDLPGYAFAHSYRTANEIGGDYYDFLEVGDGRLAIVVGDASGHGMAAGLLMAIANATLKSAMDLDPDPERVLAHLNRALCRTGDRRACMTLVYGLLSPGSGRFDFIGAGHPYPLLRRAGGVVVELGTGSLPLGIRELTDHTSEWITIEPGESLVLYSDGLPEAMSGPDGEAFGFERLAALVGGGGSPAAIHDRILRAFDAHVGDEPLTDDLTLVVLART